MSIGISRIVEEAEALLDRGHIMPALEQMELARRLTKIPRRHLALTFNIGAIHWDPLGDGVAAKAEFSSAANAEGGEYDDELSRTMRANAAENLMLCACSYEEFDRFSDRLRALAPDMPILAGLPPEVRRMRDAGEPWSAVMFHLAMTNYNRNDPALDRGRYGVAKSTYHLLLTHRRQLRLSRSDWRTAVFEYCALSMRMTNDYLVMRGGDADPDSPEEILPVLVQAVPFMDEYLASQSGDDDLRRVGSNMREIIGNLRGRWAMLTMESAGGVAPGVAAGPSTSGPFRCRRCGAPIFDVVSTCGVCGKRSRIAVFLPMILVEASVIVGVTTWYVLLHLQMSRVARISFALVTAILTLIVTFLFSLQVLHGMTDLVNQRQRNR